MKDLLLVTDNNVTVLSKKTLLEQGQILDVNDIAQLFKCGTNKAYQIIRAIKYTSDIFGLVGKIHVLDYKLYIENVASKGAGYSMPSEA